MAKMTPDRQADILAAEAEKLDNLLSEGDSDAALSVIGGIASALTSDQGNSDSDSQKKVSNSCSKRQRYIKNTLRLW